jgi:hypothetical protein
MDDKEMAKNLWELANFVAGFSVAQSLATLFAVVRGALKMFNDSRAHRRSSTQQRYFIVRTWARALTIPIGTYGY